MSYLSSSSDDEAENNDYTVEPKGSFFGTEPSEISAALKTSSKANNKSGELHSKEDSNNAETDEEEYGEDFDDDDDGVGDVDEQKNFQKEKKPNPPVQLTNQEKVTTQSIASRPQSAPAQRFTAAAGDNKKSTQVRGKHSSEYVPIIQVNSNVETEPKVALTKSDVKRGVYAPIMTHQNTLKNLYKVKESSRKSKTNKTYNGHQVKIPAKSNRPGSAPVSRSMPSFESVTGDKRSTGKECGSIQAVNKRGRRPRSNLGGASLSVQYLREAARNKRMEDKKLLFEIRLEQEKLDERVIAQMVEATRWAHTLKKQVKYSPVFEKGNSTQRGELHCEVVDQTSGKRKKLSTSLFLREHQTLKEKYEKYMKRLEKKKQQREDASQVNRLPKSGNKPIEIELRKLLEETNHVTMELQTQLDELRFRGWNAHLFWEE